MTSNSVVHFIDIKNYLIPNPLRGEDYNKWLSNTIGSTWKVLRGRREVVPWYILIWFKRYVLRYSFITWIAIKRKFMTREKLLRLNLALCHNYVLCDQEREDMNHFFFKCEFSVFIWKKLLRLYIWVHVDQTWVMFIEDLKNIFSKLPYSATVYHIWKAQNNICFDNAKMSKEATFVIIKSCVHERKTLLSNVEASSDNLSLVYNWDLFDHYTKDSTFFDCKLLIIIYTKSNLLFLAIYFYSISSQKVHAKYHIEI